MALFQSSPAPEGGCNTSLPVVGSVTTLFQSTPAPKGGCNMYSPPVLGLTMRFQSSPAPKGGCNFAYGIEGDVIGAHVSILTRPEGRVQLPTLNIPLPTPFRRLNREPPEDCATWIPP